MGFDVVNSQQPVATVGLLAGCVMDPWFTAVHEATIGVLTRAGYRVVVPESQTCCGALAAHDGAADDAVRLAACNVAAFTGVDIVVADAAGCSTHLAGYGHLTDGGEALRLASMGRDAGGEGDRGWPPLTLPLNGGGWRPDPCHLPAQRIVDAPRAILRAAGTGGESIPTGCAAGRRAYSVVRPDTSHELGGAARYGRWEWTWWRRPPGMRDQLRSHLGDGIGWRN
jgi:glycolate oxidase iron-sulfur subunit